MNFLDEILRLN